MNNSTQEAKKINWQMLNISSQGLSSVLQNATIDDENPYN
jgi:hypothetical protein